MTPCTARCGRHRCALQHHPRAATHVDRLTPGANAWTDASPGAIPHQPTTAQLFPEDTAA